MNFAIFASGNGSNAQSIIDYFSNHWLCPALIVSNTPKAFVLERASKFQIPAYIHNKNAITLLDCLLAHKIEFLVLAGYLKLIPTEIIAHYPDKILNIHPSLLPKFGGKGMYGLKVHQTVLKAKESVSGFSIHLVNEQYDEGKVLYQKTIEVPSEFTPEELMQAIQKLEHHYFPRFIEEFALKILESKM